MNDSERLRSAFRRGAAGADVPGGPDADSLLVRVHRGGRRRRARRTAAAVTVGAGSVAVVTLGVVSLGPVADPADEPAHATVRDGRASDLAVYDVHSTDDAVWALASGECGRSPLCPVVARSADGGASWDLGLPRTASSSDALGELRYLDVSPDGQYALAAGDGVATSRDAGATWQRVELARGRQVRGAAVGAARAVVVFDEPGAGALATSRTDGADWARADVPVMGDELLVQPIAGGDLVGATVLAGPGREATGLVVQVAGAQWARVGAPCATRTPLVATDGTTVWFLCHGAAGSVLATSTGEIAPDGPTDWAWTDLPAARDAGIGAAGDGAAVVATGRRAFRVDAAGRASELTGVGSGLSLPADDYTFRAAADGWLASFRGVLFHRVDSGTWDRVPVP